MIVVEKLEGLEESQAATVVVVDLGKEGNWVQKLDYLGGTDD